jgi:rare lipoprotein A
MVFFTQRNPTVIASTVPSVRMKVERPLQGIQIASLDTAKLQTRNAGVQGASFEAALRTEQGKKGAGQTQERSVDYTIKENDTLWTLAVKRFHVNPEDIMRDNGIQDAKKIQPGQKIRIRIPSYPEQTPVVASWYGREHHGKAMANGEKYNMNAATIAHKDLPLGTAVELENPVTSEKARAVVTDRGPYVAGRDVDLSYGLAKRLSLVDKGVGPLVMKVLG